MKSKFSLSVILLIPNLLYAYEPSGRGYDPDAGHAISFDLDPIKRCRISGADRLLDCFKYILCHVPLTAGLSHRGLVSGSFRTLTGSFATLGAVWLPD